MVVYPSLILIKPTHPCFMNKLITAVLMSLSLSMQAQSAKEIMYVGTYSIRGSEGIYVFEFDRKTGTMQPLQSVSNAKSPSFLALHPSGNYLYSVNEGADKSGGVSAYAIDRTTGKLTYLNEQSSLGASPCHISIDQTGHTAFVANYGGGSLAVLPIKTDGTLGAATDSVQDSGSGPNAQRQEKPHVHSATLAPDNRFVYVADLGMDKLNIFSIDANDQPGKTGRNALCNGKARLGPTPFYVSSKW